jgi:GDPmannose 4,6-dehydratase
MYDPQIVGSKLINEQTDTSPVDEYGHAKATCKKIATVLRESGQRVSTAILFNHESTLRKRGFLFPDLAEGISQYLQGKNSSVAVRDSNAIGDWHAAEDTIAGMWMQSNLDVSHDVLFCSSKVITVRELVGELFEKFFIGIPTPHLISTKNINTKPVIYGDNSFAKSLGWKPEKSVTHVLYEMVMHNLNSES